MECMTSSLSLLWNGVQLDSFSPNCGLRQRDPMSMYLFVLCMERLSLLIMDNAERRVWKPTTIARGEPAISHLLFADDILRGSADILRKFGEAYGPLINEPKSKAFVPKGVMRRKMERLAGVSSIRFSHDLGEIVWLHFIAWST